ncbi:TPA: phage holin family protein [Escherichia coli]|uniref:Phage holin family protein n=1 Tax=Escherichia coli TaxID=562 RepID=A0A4Y8GNE1_ECOLX|nr:phage holin family protein [Escherichia coli]EFH9396404.1 phage holin family protein [Escherichia coli]EFN4639887.1 phage holin family protein [Escherichia coli]EFN5655908.1 phage holin family protein [Escherichia coli]EFO2367493.1 phage holin family protein [Escherichia coli]EGM8303360.1 phage holin family protein [Escherichia coli]
MKLILSLNAIICLLITIRLFLYRRVHGTTYRPLYSWLAWLLMCCTASVAVLICFSLYRYVFIAETAINIVLLICLSAARGNVASLIKPLRHHPKEPRHDSYTHP